MIRTNRTLALAVGVTSVVALAACSSTGGKQTTSSSAAGGSKATTMTVTMITHQAPGRHVLGHHP